ncbi:MAG: type II toxin-antitoxin system HicB family antitoxin [Oscillospiraceae bacterium]|nr:type II toxin-antitoxin system HicB family antitoxin [Candidatus Limimonas egerieequi]
MNNTMIYKGYIGSVEFSEEDCLFYGSLQGIKSLVDYDGATAKELIEDFHNAVDNYLEVCTAEGIEPERPYKGSFNIRISPDLHKKAAIYAINHNVSLNSVVEQALQKALV